MQVSQLSEVLVFLGHEGDACKLQTTMDSQIKVFLAASEFITASPPPPSNGLTKSKQEAMDTLAGLGHRTHELRLASWKWDLLRPVTRTSGI